MFAVQKERRGVDQVQFHVPPATSLLRLHVPQRFGDDLSRFRPMVKSVNQERAPRGGLAIAAGGPAIFGVAPVRDMQGTHAGSVEFGLDFGPLLDGLKASYGLDLTLFIDEKPLREFATSLNPAILGDQNRVGRFIRFHSTNAALARELATDADISAVKEPRATPGRCKAFPMACCWSHCATVPAIRSVWWRYPETSAGRAPRRVDRWFGRSAWRSSRS